MVSDNSTIGDSIIEDVSEVSETNLDADSGDQVTRLQLFSPFSTPLQFPISLPYRSNLNKFKYQFRYYVKLLLFNVHVFRHLYILPDSILVLVDLQENKGGGRCSRYRKNKHLYSCQPTGNRSQKPLHLCWTSPTLFFSLFLSPHSLC